jgi:hypothetical protein
MVNCFIVVCYRLHQNPCLSLSKWKNNFTKHRKKLAVILSKKDGYNSLQLPAILAKCFMSVVFRGMP